MSNELTRIILQNICEKSIKKEPPYKRKENFCEKEVNIIKDLIYKKDTKIFSSQEEKTNSKEDSVQYMSLEELVRKKRK